MNDQRPAWEPDLLDQEQLDLFASAHADVDESAGMAGEVRVYQLTELPGESFEDIFGDAA